MLTYSDNKCWRFYLSRRFLIAIKIVVVIVAILPARSGRLFEACVYFDRQKIWSVRSKAYKILRIREECFVRSSKHTSAKRFGMDASRAALKVPRPSRLTKLSSSKSKSHFSDRTFSDSSFKWRE